MYAHPPAVIWPYMMRPLASNSWKVSHVDHLGTRCELAISTLGARRWVLMTPTGLPDWTSSVSSFSNSRSDSMMASKHSQSLAALPVPPYMISSWGFSAFSRLFWSILSMDSCLQPLQESVSPLAALMFLITLDVQETAIAI